MATVLTRQTIAAGEAVTDEYTLPLTTAEIIYVIKRYDWPDAGAQTLTYHAEIDTGAGWQNVGGGTIAGGVLDGIEEHRESISPETPYAAGTKARLVMTAASALETQVDLGLTVWP